MEELTRNQADAKKLEFGQITQGIKNLEKAWEQFLYDRGAVFIVIFLSVFAMFMAFCDTLVQYAGVIWKR